MEDNEAVARLAPEIAAQPLQVITADQIRAKIKTDVVEPILGLEAFSKLDDDDDLEFMGYWDQLEKATYLNSKEDESNSSNKDNLVSNSNQLRYVFERMLATDSLPAEALNWYLRLGVKNNLINCEKYLILASGRLLDNPYTTDSKNLVAGCMLFEASLANGRKTDTKASPELQSACESAAADIFDRVFRTSNNIAIQQQAMGYMISLQQREVSRYEKQHLNLMSAEHMTKLNGLLFKELEGLSHRLEHADQDPAALSSIKGELAEAAFMSLVFDAITTAKLWDKISIRKAFPREDGPITARSNEGHKHNHEATDFIIELNKSDQVEQLFVQIKNVTGQESRASIARKYHEDVAVINMSEVNPSAEVVAQLLIEKYRGRGNKEQVGLVKQIEDEMQELNFALTYKSMNNNQLSKQEIHEKLKELHQEHSRYLEEIEANKTVLNLEHQESLKTALSRCLFNGLSRGRVSQLTHDQLEFVINLLT